ncbi:ABC transporter ATP-binding protein [Glutamicibacter sp. PS]|uniref:ABC transporter ATP-binding protein n=1 Tax=Glutamicibacter sp. PS TaxID=3075634 RepID=UPI00284E1E7A|nr:ABC transporter ATP-binding protein [Glutamicibacter sp. PS]MDR4534237.1 ABC transporter ATP-binding protein [Glutamicibacter sp. PS]
MSRLLTVENLSVDFAGAEAVRGVKLQLDSGECLGLVGESGSGKSVTARSLLGLSGGTVRADALRIAGTDALALNERGWRALRGATVSMVLQDALLALDPLRPIGKEIADALRVHGRHPRAERRRLTLNLLEALGMDDPARRITARSGELSGGQRQRALIAQALIAEPQLVIADEATTALDTRLAALVLEQLRAVKQSGRGVLMISHDLAQVAQVADRIAVMRQGRIVETGPTAELLHNPTHEYTRMLLRAIPAGVPRHTPLSQLGERITLTPRNDKLPAAASDPTPALRVENLSKSFDGIPAVRQVSFELPRGQSLGLVGESGSGKTTTARMVLGLTTPDGGQVRVNGKLFTPLPERERRTARPQLGAVYQNPMASFDPRFTVGMLLADALSKGRNLRVAGQRTAITELLDTVRLPAKLAERYPFELSGGQRQRVAIARALAPAPKVLVLDEPVSALDVSVQAQVLDLLDEIQRTTGTSYLFISHDLAVIEHVSDRVAVMRGGQLVEQGTATQIFTQPQHEYTRSLLQALPRLG